MNLPKVGSDAEPNDGGAAGVAEGAGMAVAPPTAADDAAGVPNENVVTGT